MDKTIKQSTKRKVGFVAPMEFILTIVPSLIFYYTFSHHYKEATFYNKGNYLFFIVYWAILILFMSIYGACNVQKYRTRELAFAFVLSSLFTDVITYFVMCMIAMQLLAPWPALLTILVQWLAEASLYVICRIMIGFLEPQKEALYIGNITNGDNLVGKFDPRRTNYIISEQIDSNLPLEELKSAMGRFNTVVFGDVDISLRNKMMDFCFQNGISILLKPNMRDIMIGCGETVIMNDCMLYELHTGIPRGGYLVAKRILDMTISAFGLILTSPILIGVAIAIKAQDGGPVFYRQMRLTKDGKPFMLTKFRSMVTDAELNTGAILASKEDARITKVGKFIRATRIDELPQLLNILSGEMTLVGPRPERPEFYDKYCSEYPEFIYRLQAKAGLTGYAQLYGKYNTSFEDKARMDMQYIQKASFLLDVQLILYTLKIIFVKESTEGVEDDSFDYSQGKDNC